MILVLTLTLFIHSILPSSGDYQVTSLFNAKLNSMRSDTSYINSLQLHDNSGGDSALYRAKSPSCVGSDPMLFLFHGSDHHLSARAHYIDQTMAKNSTQRRKQQERSRGPGGRFASSTPGGTTTRPDNDPSSTARSYSAVVASATSPGSNPPTTSIAEASLTAPSVMAPSVSILDQGSVTQSAGGDIAPAIAQDFTSKSSSGVKAPPTLPVVSTPSPVASALVDNRLMASSATSTVPTMSYPSGSGTGSPLASTATSGSAGHTTTPGKSAHDDEGVVEDASASQSSFPRRFFTTEEIDEMRRAERELRELMLDPTQKDLHADLQAIIDDHDAELEGLGGDAGPPVDAIHVAQVRSLRDLLQKDKEDMRAMLDSMRSYSTEFEDRRRKWEDLDGCVMRRIERVQEMLDPEHIEELVTAPVRREVHYLLSEETGTMVSEFKTALADILEDNIAEFKSNVASFRLDAAEALTSLRDDINAQMIATGQAHTERLQQMESSTGGVSSASTPPVSSRVPARFQDTMIGSAASQMDADFSTPERVDHRGYPIITRGGTGLPRDGVRFAPSTLPGTFVSTGDVPPDLDRLKYLDDDEDEGSVVHRRRAQEERIGRGGVASVHAEDAQEDRIGHIGSHSGRWMGLQDYHGGRSGLEEGVDLSGITLQQLGFSHLGSFPEVIRLHRTIRRNWYHHTLNTYGPQRDTILNSKALLKLTLEKFDPCSVLAWYEKLVTTCEAYKIGLMPFDAMIQFAKGALGLCLPGLGSDRFTEMASGLCSVLQVCLAKAPSRVTTMAAQVESRTRNGYDILWRVLRLYVPGFDPTKTVERPLWGDSDGDVIRYANKFDLFFRLSVKNGHSHSDVVKATLFLTGITEPAMMKVVEPLLIAVESAASVPPMDGSLPPRLCFDELAIKISERMVVEPSERRVLTLSTSRSPELCEPVDEVGSVSTISLQGTSPTLAVADGRQSRGSERSGRPQHLTHRPDPTNRIRSPTADEVCEACGKRGHVASTCDFLAMSVFLRKFTKQGKLTELAAKDAEKRWLEKWSSKGGKPHTTPNRVYNAYTSMYDVSLEQLDRAIDWQCWLVDIELDE